MACRMGAGLRIHECRYRGNLEPDRAASVEPAKSKKYFQKNE